MSLPAVLRRTVSARKRISIVLVDDNPSAQAGVVALIRAQRGFHVLAASAEFGEALQKVREKKPDVVLLNLRQKGDNTLTLAGALHGEAPASRVIIMGLEPRQTDLARLVRAGVSGFIMASASFDNLLGTIHSVAQGIKVLPPDLTPSLFGQLTGHGGRTRPKRTSDVRRLTNRERAVAHLIVQGLSNKAIAGQLQIALHTVKSHVSKVLSKLAVSSRVEVGAFSQLEIEPELVPGPSPLASTMRVLIPSI